MVETVEDAGHRLLELVEVNPVLGIFQGACLVVGVAKRRSVGIDLVELDDPPSYRRAEWLAAPVFDAANAVLQRMYGVLDLADDLEVQFERVAIGEENGETPIARLPTFEGRVQKRTRALSIAAREVQILIDAAAVEKEAMPPGFVEVAGRLLQQRRVVIEDFPVALVIVMIFGVQSARIFPCCGWSSQCIATCISASTSESVKLRGVPFAGLAWPLRFSLKSHAQVLTCRRSTPSMRAAWDTVRFIEGFPRAKVKSIFSRLHQG